MLKVGIVGFGFMGRMHYRCWKARKDARVVALCDAKKEVLEQGKKSVGNIRGAEEEVDYSGITLHTDFDRMLAETPLDVLSITLPTALHAPLTIKALEAGVNVLCEKPMALTTAECEAMIQGRDRSGKNLLIGHCVRFWPEYARAKEMVAGGEYGPVLAASFLRLSHKPVWSADNWLIKEERSGGMALDLHIHDSDYVQYLFGLPEAVQSFGARGTEGTLDHMVTQYLYSDRKAVLAEGGWAMAPSFGFRMSFHLVLEKASILFDSTRKPTIRVCPARGEAFTPALEPGDGYSREIDHFARVIQGENLAPVITIEESRDAVRLVEAERESMETGKRVSLNQAFLRER